MGQAALTAALRQPASRQAKAVQSLPQHGQHALALPGLTQLAQHSHLGIKGFFVAGQSRQLSQGQAHTGQCQARAHQSRVLWRGHGAQPMHQIARFVGLVDRVFVRQKHRGDLALLQGLLHRQGLCARAHQNGNVLRTQALQCAIGLGKAIAGIVQPSDDLLRTALGKALARHARGQHVQLMHQVDSGQLSRRGDPFF